MMKLLNIIIAILTTVLLSLVIFTRDPIGFINEDIYYKMTANELIDVLGEPHEKTGVPNDHIVYYYDLMYEEISGEASFTFYNDKLISIIFDSDDNSCDMQQAVNIINEIKTKYKNKNYYEQNEHIDENSYSILFGQTNGAAGKDIVAEYKNGILSIKAELME